MHRRFLKLKVMAALFSAAFLLGTSEAGAYNVSLDSVTVTDEDQTQNTDYINKVNFTGRGTLTLVGVNGNYVLAREIYLNGNDGMITNTDTVSSDTSYYGIRSILIAGTDSASDLSIGNRYGTIISENLLVEGENASEYGVNPGIYNVKNITISNRIAVQHAKVINSALNAGGIITATEATNSELNAGDEIGVGSATNSELNAGESIYFGAINAFTVNNSKLTTDGYIKKAQRDTIGSITNSTLDAGSYIDIYNYNNGDTTQNAIINSTLKAGDNINVRCGDVTNSILTADSYIFVSIANVTNSVLNAGSYIKVYNGSVTNSIINASTVAITKDLTLNTNYIQTGYAKLSGGLNVNNQKITGLEAGNIGEASTDLINGSQLYDIKGKTGDTNLSAGNDVSISEAHAISVNKTGIITANDAGIMSGDTVCSVTGAIQSSLDGVTSSVSKNSTTITSLQDGMADLKKSIANINSTVASTTKNLSSSLSNRLQADLGNLSGDGKSVIKNLIAETLRSMNISTAAIASTDEASLNTAAISSVSIMPATVDGASMVISKPVTTSVTSADVDGVYDVLGNKVGKTDFETMKAGVDSNASAILVNANGIKANTSAIDTLKTSKANADGSNLDVGAYTEKLGTGKIEKDNTGLVNGGGVYGALNKKADVSYVDAGLNTMNKKLDSMKQTVTRDMNRMGANAAALASLHPQDYDSEDKLDFAAGYGHYHDSNATAVGAFYRPNAATMVSLAGTIGNGDSMISAGLSFKLGMNDKVEKVMISKDTFDKQQVENRQMKGHLDDQTARLQQMEAALSAMIAH